MGMHLVHSGPVVTHRSASGAQPAGQQVCANAGVDISAYAKTRIANLRYPIATSAPLSRRCAVEGRSPPKSASAVSRRRGRGVRHIGTPDKCPGRLPAPSIASDAYTNSRGRAPAPGSRDDGARAGAAAASMDAARFYAVGRGFVPSGDCGGEFGRHRPALFQGEQLGAGSRELYGGSGFVKLEPARAIARPARLVWWKGAENPLSYQRRYPWWYA